METIFREKIMKYYIVYFNSITQYGITNSGYYVGYKNKCEDHYSNDYIFAKLYKSLTPALTRLGVSYTEDSALRLMKRINSEIDNNIRLNRKIKLSTIDKKNINFSLEDKLKYVDLTKILCENGRIEIVEIDNNIITHLGKISNLEIYNYIKKQSDNYNITYEDINHPVFTKEPTDDDIEFFCSHMDNIHESFEKSN